MTKTQKNHTVSVIIPTLNGESSLPEFFSALHMQDMKPDEVLVGDSMSEDSTVEICRKAGASVLSIPRGEFDHGGTRTLLAKKAIGDILVYFTQDAILARPDALSTLIGRLQSDKTLCCSYGRQLPKSDATLLSAHLRLFNYPEISGVRSAEDTNKYGLKTIFISNSFAAYKRIELESVGYFMNGLIFGEDTCTLGRLLMAGHQVAYESQAAVYHSHNYRIAEEFQRSFDIGVLHETEKWLLETFGGAEGIGSKYVLSALKELLALKKYHLIPDWLLRSAAKFTGYKLGRSYKMVPKRVVPLCSLHSFWWNNNNATDVEQ